MESQRLRSRFAPNKVPSGEVGLRSKHPTDRVVVPSFRMKPPHHGKLPLTASPHWLPNLPLPPPQVRVVREAAGGETSQTFLHRQPSSRSPLHIHFISALALGSGRRHIAICVSIVALSSSLRLREYLSCTFYTTFSQMNLEVVVVMKI